MYINNKKVVSHIRLRDYVKFYDDENNMIGSKHLNEIVNHYINTVSGVSGTK